MITLQHIAKAAGVGKSTVSRVINGDKNVNAQTRQRITQLVDELGYIPNIAARSMRTNRTFSIGVVFPDISNPFFAKWYSVVNEEMDKHGYMSYISITDPLGKSELRKLEELSSRNIDGIIFSSYVKNPEVFAKLTQLSKKMAVVCTDQFAFDQGLPCVASDGFQSSVEAVTHLKKQGRSRVGYIKAHSDFETTQLRFEGFKKGLEMEELPFFQEYVFEGAFQYEDGIRAAEYFMSLPTPPDAIMAATDYMALGCQDRLMELGVRMPKDVAMLGYDDISSAATSKPKLTSVRLPYAEWAQKAVALLMDQVNEQHELSSEILPCELILRESSSSDAS